jgi:hypothetical protein
MTKDKSYTNSSCKFKYYLAADIKLNMSVLLLLPDLQLLWRYFHSMIECWNTAALSSYCKCASKFNLFTVYAEWDVRVKQTLIKYCEYCRHRRWKKMQKVRRKFEVLRVVWIKIQAVQDVAWCHWANKTLWFWQCHITEDFNFWVSYSVRLFLQDKRYFCWF